MQLQHQLDVLRKQEQQSDEDKEFAKVQEMLSGLQVGFSLSNTLIDGWSQWISLTNSVHNQQQVTHLAHSRSSDSIPPLAPGGSSHEPRDYGTDPDLKSLKVRTNSYVSVAVDTVS